MRWRVTDEQTEVMRFCLSCLNTLTPSFSFKALTSITHNPPEDGIKGPVLARTNHDLFKPLRLKMHVSDQEINN